MSSYPPPPADATDVLPGEDGGDYASRKAEAATWALAARLWLAWCGESIPDCTFEEIDEEKRGDWWRVACAVAAETAPTKALADRFEREAKHADVGAAHGKEHENRDHATAAKAEARTWRYAAELLAEATKVPR